MGRAAREAPFETPSSERYQAIWDNPFLVAADTPLSTFAIDVDTASYSNVRRFLAGGQRPPLDAVRIEELVNYFPYDDPLPDAEGEPLRVNLELTEAPWQPAHLLLRVNLASRPIAFDRRPLSNLVFLLDVSGSMQDPAKLPLVKQSLRMLVEHLGENDRVAIVVYAGASGLVLPSTSGLDKATILDAIDRLEAGGSTHGSEGIALAYDTAVGSFIPGGANRVILATDGDFNVGITNPTDLETLIADKARSGVFLTVLGFGMGNLKDETLERLADRGNGLYGYVDSLSEARKLFVEQISGTLVTVAKDVKLQLEFNPERVAGYRLLGYENRLLAAADFNDDTKDAGDVGAGHRVTALYEIVPTGSPVPTAIPAPSPAPTAHGYPEPPSTPATDVGPTATPDVDPLRYADPDAVAASEILTVKLRYKLPDAEASTRSIHPLPDRHGAFTEASASMRFSAAVAAFGMLLRGSPHSGSATYADARAWAESALGDDPAGYRVGFIDLIDRANALPSVP
jgi:Ca-activated chloride channel homolog